MPDNDERAYQEYCDWLDRGTPGADYNARSGVDGLIWLVVLIVACLLLGVR